MKDTNKQAYHRNDNAISVSDFLNLCLRHGLWFVWSLMICISFALYYLATTPNMYTCESAILVKQESQGKNTGTRDGQEEFSTIGIVQQNINVSNVQRHLISLNVIMEVVRRLHLAADGDSIHTAERIQKRLRATIDDDKSTIINLKYVDYSPYQAENVLATLVSAYNEQWVKDKNEIAISTSQFIKARLELIEKDLNNVDDSISTYKSRNKITDLGAVSDIYLQQMSQSEADIMRLNNQKAMAQYIHDLLMDKSGKYQLLPSNSGINDQIVETQMSQYNAILLQLNSHLAYTSDQNPLIINQKNELNHLRANIIGSVDNLIKTLTIQLRTIQGYNGDASSKIISNPEQAKHLVSIERKQKVKESLYLYLLQKLEENGISMTYTAYNTQVIDIPHGSNEPSSPKSRNILLASIIIGLLLPASIIFIQTSLDTTIRDKDDLEHKTSIPLIGEIPLNRTEKKKSLLRLLRKVPYKDERLVVEPGRQGIINEAFRLIRSNLEFMTDESLNKDNIYIVTSNYPGSGKTFVSMNLAVTLAIKEKKVLFIDGDLRHASASAYWVCSKLGLSNYLSGKEDDVDRLMIKLEEYPTLDILPVGVIPPNPTELLSNDRLRQLFEAMRPKYDYIFVDCPPAEMLADARIIEKLADRTLFIVRAGLFERKRIADLEADFQAGKHKHTSLILNCVKEGGRYGYKYGYRYGYRYGYHNKHTS